MLGRLFLPKRWEKRPDTDPAAGLRLTRVVARLAAFLLRHPAAGCPPQWLSTALYPLGNNIRIGRGARLCWRWRFGADAVCHTAACSAARALADHGDDCHGADCDGRVPGGGRGWASVRYRYCGAKKTDNGSRVREDDEPCLPRRSCLPRHSRGTRGIHFDISGRQGRCGCVNKPHLNAAPPAPAPAPTANHHGPQGIKTDRVMPVGRFEHPAFNCTKPRLHPALDWQHYTSRVKRLRYGSQTSSCATLRTGPSAKRRLPALSTPIGAVAPRMGGVGIGLLQP